ncbi:MAG: peptidyl-prolyl cis-trans isomerase [Syntrophobacterales bacterium]|nr:MAG: peptidyl-prolyl cis-trans isomerase [Syntrophobacterales bacterium]
MVAPANQFAKRGEPPQGIVVQFPFRFLKRIFDHSKARFTKNGYQKFSTVHSRRFGQHPIEGNGMYCWSGCSPIIWIALLIGLYTMGCQKEDPNLPKGILAQVNEELITLEEFNNELRDIKLEHGKLPEGRESLDQLKTALLDQIIDRKLILGEARQMDIQVSEQEINKAILALKRDYAGESFKAMLNGRGMSFEEWKRRVKEKLLAEKVIHSVAQFASPIDDKSVRQYYMEHIEKYSFPEQVRARQIVVATETEAKEILRRLRRGTDFAELAQEKSMMPERVYGGDLGFFARGEMPEAFDEVFSLKVGGVSKVIKSPYGYHIFKVDEKVEAKVREFDEVKDEIAHQIRKNKREQIYYNWLSELREKAKININKQLLEYTH